MRAAADQPPRSRLRGVGVAVAATTTTSTTSTVAGRAVGDLRRLPLAADPARDRPPRQEVATIRRRDGGRTGQAAGEGARAARLRRRAAPAQAGLHPRRALRQGQGPHAISVPERELRRVLTGDGGLHAILDVVLEGQKTTHAVDPQGVPAGSDPRAHLAHRPAGGPPRPADPGERHRRSSSASRAGVKEGGVLSQVQREINVEALPMEIPEHIDLDVSGMAIGDTLRLADLAPMEGVTYLDDPGGDGARDASTMPTRGSSRSPRRSQRARSCAEGEVPEGEAPEGAAEGEAAADAARASRASPAPPRAKCASPGVEANAPRRSICSSSGSAIPAASTRGHRHNVGWMVVDELARRHGASWRGKFYGQLAELRLDGHRVALLKPETYMNESGRSVAAAARFFKLEPDAILVVHDEGDLDPAGCRRARAAASPATTACARSRSTSKTPDFLRLRIGVGRPGPRRPAAAGRLRALGLRAGGRRRRARRAVRPTRSRRSTPKASSARRRSSTKLATRSSGTVRGYHRIPPNPPGSAFRHGPVRSCIRSSASSARASGSRGFAEALPAAARVSEPALPLLLAALHEELDRPLVLLVPEDADARDAAEAAAWFLGEERVALLPSRGVHWGSGLEPAPHLVGERARALDVLAAAGSSVASAAALAEAMPPAGRASGADPDRARRGARPRAARRVARARRLRTRRARRRARTVRRARRARRRLPDDRARAAAHRVLGRRDRADARVLAVHAARAASGRGGRRLPGRRAAARPRRDDARSTRTSRSRSRTISCRRCRRGPISSGRPTRCARSGRRRGSSRCRSSARPCSTRFRPASRSRSRRSGRRSSPAGSRRRRTSSDAFVRAGNRVVVAFPHLGEALRQQNLLRRVDARAARGRGASCRASRSSSSPSRPRAAASSGATSGSSLLPDTQVFRKRPPRERRVGGRALQSFADLRTRRLRRPRGPRRRQAARLRDEGGRGRHARLPLPRRSAATTGSTSRTSSSARSRATSAPTTPRPRCRSSAARRGTTSRTARASRCASSPASCSRSTRSGSRRRASPYDLRHEWLERLEAEFPYRETPDQQAAIEAVKEDLEAPRPMDRLVCGDVGFGKTEVAIRAAFAVAVNGKQTLMLAPTTILAEQHWHTFRDALPRLPRAGRDGLPLPAAARGEAGARGLPGGEGRRPDRDAPGPQPRRDPEGARPRHPRRGAALRRRAEGAAALAAPRGRRAHAERDADPAHAAHVALRPARHLDHRDAARRAPPDPHDRRRVRRGAREARARARDRARRPGLLPAQPRRDDRRGGGEAAAARAEPALPRRARPDARARARGEDARVPARRRRRARLDDDHRVRPRHPAGEHA